ncbi:hypothetical protein RAS1_18010 [Phycisphaerae bacterium RAS1]|nr:hypothetical protein RAS1_18010 [Phycisphaerae bacterium RAS1]
MPGDVAFMEKLTALCKRRGFIFPSSEVNPKVWEASGREVPTTD